MAPPHDYSLTGPSSRYALEHGLANAEWYRAPIPRTRMKELMKRSDGPAIRDRRLPGDRWPRCPFLADLVVDPVLPCLWRALWLLNRLALA